MKRASRLCLSSPMYAPPETFTALYDDIIELLEAKYEQSTWEVHSQDDVTEDSEYRDALDRLQFQDLPNT